MRLGVVVVGRGVHHSSTSNLISQTFGPEPLGPAGGWVEVDFFMIECFGRDIPTDSF